MYDAVRQLLEENRLEVLAVAHALETHRTVNGEDVVAIIDGQEGPLVDGRGYYTPESSEALERYHRAIIEVRSRGEDDLPPLPPIDGVTGRTVEPVPVPLVAASTPAAPAES
jgi:hypothetical protein